MSEKIYTMKVTLKGEPHILTVRIGNEYMDIMLTDDKGNMVEYLKQEGNTITVSGGGAKLKSK